MIFASLTPSHLLKVTQSLLKIFLFKIHLPLSQQPPPLKLRPRQASIFKYLVGGLTPPLPPAEKGVHTMKLIFFLLSLNWQL